MKKIFFKNARIIDGLGSAAQENGMLIVEAPEAMRQKGKILYVGSQAQCALQPAPTDEVVDLIGYSLLPGIFDCHVHLWGSTQKPMFKADHLGPATRTLMCYRNAMDALIAGVTTLRAVGGSDDIDISLRDAVEKGMVWGPRVVACGSPIEPYGGHCHVTWGTIECSGPADFAKAARIQMGKGVDQIKLMYTGGAAGGRGEGMFDTHITDEEAAAVCHVAHMAGRRVAAHLSNDYAVRSALNAGVDSIEHAYEMSEETAKLLAEKKAYYVPTMCTTGDAAAYNAENMPEYHKIVRQRLIDAHQTHLKSLEYAVKAGATICVGTDNLPAANKDGAFGTLHEIILLAQSGMTPLEAIKAGTYNSAELCGLEKQTGSLREGLYADLTVFKGKPDISINDLKNLSMVAKEGRIVWSSVEGYHKTRCFAMLPQDGAPTDDLANQW